MQGNTSPPCLPVISASVMYRENDQTKPFFFSKRNASRKNYSCGLNLCLLKNRNSVNLEDPTHH